MQVEKHLFRIAERANRNENAPLCWNIIFIISFCATIIFGLIFMAGEIIIRPNNQILNDCLNSVGQKIQNDSIGIIYESNEVIKNYLAKTSTQLLSFKNSSVCQIFKNLNDTNINEKSRMQFSFMKGLISLEAIAREEMNFSNYTFYFKQLNKFQEFLYGIENLLTLELLENAEHNKKRFVEVKANNIHVYQHGQSQNSRFSRFLLILQIILAYGLSSIATSLYIYVTIVTSPAVILLFIRCTRFGRVQNFLQISKVFPWIAMHSLIRQSSQNSTVKNNVDDICKSLLSYFVIMYLIYYLIVLEINRLFFITPSENGVQELYFGYLAIVEFAALIFMRTRPFLRYFPVAYSLSLFLFLLYSKFSLYGFKLYAMLIVHSFGICLFSWMMLKLEIPAQTIWDGTQNYVPTLERPRVGMLPTFNLNWISSLPEQWTLFMPLFSRGNFNDRELALVDQKYEELNQILNE